MQKRQKLKKKQPDITNLDTKISLNTKATETENKIPDTTSFLTTPEINRLTKIGLMLK